MGSLSTIFFLSSSNPHWLAAASAISFEEMDPKVFPPSPAFMESFTPALPIFSANAFASSSCCFAIFSSLAFLSLRLLRLAGVASRPFLREIRKFLAYPSLTSTISPFFPRLLTSSVSITFILFRPPRACCLMFS